VEGAAADQVITAVFLEFDAGGLDQAHDRDLGFQAGDLFVGDAGHIGGSPKILSSPRRDFFRTFPGWLFVIQECTIFVRYK